MNKSVLIKNIMKNVSKSLNESFDFENDMEEDARLITPKDFNTSGIELFKTMGRDGREMVDCYEDAYEYFFQDFALFCKYQNSNVLKEFLNFKRNQID